MKIEIGSGVFVLLTIVLVVAKIVGIITLPWIWVLCPLWIAPALVLGIIGIVLGFILFILLFVLVVLILFSPLILIGILIYYLKKL